MWLPELGGDGQVKYRTIADAIAADVAAGRLRGGERLPTQRALASNLGITVGTVGRAYALAERRGLIESTVGRGSFVRDRSGRERGGRRVDLGLNVPPRIVDGDAFSASLLKLAEAGDMDALFHTAPTVPGGAQSWGGSVPDPESSELEAAAWIARRMDCSADEIEICAGTQPALVAVLMTVCSPGSGRLLVESVCFPGALAAARALGLAIVSVPIDGEGLIPAELEQLARPGDAVYCVPTNHNPTTATMSLARRRVLARVVTERRLTLIEDDTYGLCLTRAPAPVAAFAPAHSFLLSSLSKTVAIGLRLAFLRVPPAHKSAIQRGLRAISFFPPPLLVALAARWIRDGSANRWLLAKRAECRARMAIARDLLDPFGLRGENEGQHAWLDLDAAQGSTGSPGGGPVWTAEAFTRAALARDVVVFPSTSFRTRSQGGPNAIRLALGGAPDHTSLRSALERLRELLLAPETGPPAGY